MKIMKIMKKLLFILCILTYLVACAPSIDTKLDQLEAAYKAGKEQKANKIWYELWERQNEMYMTQVNRYIVLTEKYDPEWNYDYSVNQEPQNRIEEYFSRCPERIPKKIHVTQPTYSNNSSQLSYYECRYCGMVIKSTKRPNVNSGTCRDKVDGHIHGYHFWQRLCNVGSAHVVQCRICGLSIQCNENHFHIEKGCCRDGRSGHQWETVY